MLAGAGILAMVAFTVPAGYAAAAPARPNSVATTAICPDYLFMSDTPGSTNYVDYCGPDDVVQVECNVVFNGANWDRLVIDSVYFRGWLAENQLAVIDPSLIPVCSP